MVLHVRAMMKMGDNINDKNDGDEKDDGSEDCENDDDKDACNDHDSNDGYRDFLLEILDAGFELQRVL